VDEEIVVLHSIATVLWCINMVVYLMFSYSIFVLWRREGKTKIVFLYSNPYDVFCDHFVMSS
jgi:hypothetical protein